jgi:Txe/YoeB family toxin of toxin-antitoxin system
MAEGLLDLIGHAPYQSPTRFEKLVGNLSGAFTRRISVQHRLVYEVMGENGIVKVLQAWVLRAWASQKESLEFSIFSPADRWYRARAKAVYCEELLSCSETPVEL